MASALSDRCAFSKNRSRRMLSVFSERFADAVHAKAGRRNGCSEALSRRTEEHRKPAQPGGHKHGSFVTARTGLSIGMSRLADVRLALPRNRRRQKLWTVARIAFETSTGRWPKRDGTR